MAGKKKGDVISAQIKGFPRELGKKLEKKLIGMIKAEVEKKSDVAGQSMPGD